MIYFTADTHYGHENILKYATRPFENVNQMDKVLIRNHNEVVTKEDVVYFLGDFSLKSARYLDYYESILNKLNGRKVLILGNHDELSPFQYIKVGFESVHTSLELSGLILIHDPAIASMDKTKEFLCGHVHGLFTKCGNAFNVGVDVWGYRPITLEQIQNYCYRNL